VLEYWIDVSLFSGYRRPVKKLPFLPEVMKQDLRFYSSLGFRRVTSFACWLREEYVQNFGRSDVEEYCRCFLEVDAE